MPEGEYRLLVTPPAQRGLDRLPAAAAAAVVEFLLGDLLRDPRRVGKPLRGELCGTWSARRGPYRVVCSVLPESATIAVLRIDHRADVYRGR
jgi:mRNA interferase RelE/StbE